MLLLFSDVVHVGRCASRSGPMYLKCLVLFLSGPMELLFSLCFIATWTCVVVTGQVGLGVGSWPSNRATEGSNPKGTRLYFVILLKNVEKSLIGTDITV